MILYLRTHDGKRHLAVDTANKVFDFRAPADKKKTVIPVTEYVLSCVMQDAMDDGYKMNWYKPDT